MRQLFLGVLMLSLMGVPSIAATIDDVSLSDPAYPAVRKAVEAGYLPLYGSGSFMPNQAVSRQELAIILDRAAAYGSSGLLSKSELQDLLRLSKTFKNYLADQDSSAGRLVDRMAFVENEQKSIQFDMSRLVEENQQLKKRADEQQLFLWVTLGVAILGVVR